MRPASVMKRRRARTKTNGGLCQVRNLGLDFLFFFLPDIFSSKDCIFYVSGSFLPPFVLEREIDTFDLLADP